MKVKDRDDLFKFDKEFEDWFVNEYTADMNDFDAMHCRSELYNIMKMGWRARRQVEFDKKQEKNKKLQMLYKEIY